MSNNPYDQASRYLARLEPPAFLAWLMGLAPNDLIFRGWLDTRLIPFPGEPDRFCDTVAFLESVRQGQAPWAVILEFQIAPDSLMFGRLLGYFSPIWIELKPVAERGDRFLIGTILVNLTGRGNAARTMTWDEAGMTLELKPREVNLCEKNAKETLDGIAEGPVPNVVLALIPLMRDGDNPVIIQRWLELAAAEPKDRRRSELGSLALIFAGATTSLDHWKEALKGWNMIQSPVVQEWLAQGKAEGKAEGEAKGKAAALLRLLELRHSPIPTAVQEAIRAANDVAILDAWFDAAVTSPSLADFRQATGL